MTELDPGDAAAEGGHREAGGEDVGGAPRAGLLLPLRGAAGGGCAAAQRGPAAGLAGPHTPKVPGPPAGGGQTPGASRVS
jgi:hypothetical protein